MCNNHVEYRICSKCGESKELNEENYRLRHDNNVFRKECNICLLEYQKIRREKLKNNQITINHRKDKSITEIDNILYKKCKMCNETKELENNFKLKEFGMRHTKCSSCMYEKRKEKRKKNKKYKKPSDRRKNIIINSLVWYLDLLTYRVCKKCGVEKELNENNFPLRLKEKIFKHQCCECLKKYQEERRGKVYNSKTIVNSLKPGKVVISEILSKAPKYNKKLEGSLLQVFVYNFDYTEPRICTKCNLEKDLVNNFKKIKYGFNYICNLCHEINYKKRIEKKLKKLKEKRAAKKAINNNYIILNINGKEHKKCIKCDEIKELHIDYFHFRSDTNKWRGACKKCVSYKGKIYINNNKEKILKRKEKYNKRILTDEQKEEKNKKMREWYDKNKVEIRKRKNEYEKNKKENDPYFKAHKILSGQMRIYLKKQNLSKQERSVFEILDYTREDFKNHIENLFEPWMNWNNHGIYKHNEWNDKDQSTWTWQIDHIIPASNFKYDSLEHSNFKKCWSLDNLRPYSAKQNILDGNRRL